MLLAGAYRLGRCGSSVSGQALWRHGRCELFIALSTYALPSKPTSSHRALSSLGFAFAVLCRPSTALLAALVALHIAITDWHRFPWFALGAMARLVVAALRFIWWEDWCFGYRPVVFTAILLALLCLPVLERIARSRRMKVTCAIGFGYGVAVQLLGAYAYDASGWNGRVVWEVRPEPSSVYCRACARLRDLLRCHAYASRAGSLCSCWSPQ